MRQGGGRLSYYDIFAHHHLSPENSDEFVLSGQGNANGGAFTNPGCNNFVLV